MVNIEKFLHLLFPTGCVYCGRLSDEKIHGLCPDCRGSLPIYLKKADNTWYIFEYDKKFSRILKKAKYGGKPGSVKVLAGLLGDLLSSEGVKADLVTYVPMHKRELGERGYNQSGIAARKIARILGVNCSGRALVKLKQTKKQADLSKKARSNNLAGAFAADRQIVSGKKILLIDDIITTGSTINECRNALMAAGAVNVDSAVIAHTPPNREK
ncbi:MAG: ComF family protein [Clostridia bacterium]|nr:ComF family protein [Clostridia bacterium]